MFFPFIMLLIQVKIIFINSSCLDIFVQKCRVSKYMFGCPV